MPNQVDLYNSTYGNFQEQVLAEIRRETYGEDIGQNSWITTDEYDTFYSWRDLSAGDHVLEIASGSGGSALYLAERFRCRITGLDINEEGIKTANQQASDANVTGAKFQLADVNQRLPTSNIELTSGRWHASRQKHRADLIKIEGQERFDGLQKFLSTVYQLTSERRLSRFVFTAE